VATRIIAPKLGVSTDPVLVVEWKANEGDRVKQGDVVVVIETEKIRNDMEAEASGYLHIVVEDGGEAEIGSSIGLIAETKEELESLQKEAPAGPAAPAAVSETGEVASVEVATPVSTAAEGERICITPIARKIAAEHMIDVARLVGTGPGGRIVRADVEKAVEAQRKVEAVPAGAPGEVREGKRVKSTIPLSGIRRSIAEHMHRSLSVAAQLTVMGELDMTEMVRMRQGLLAQEDVLGTRISYTDLLVYTVARVLREYPIVNSSVVENEIKLWEDINVAVAVATDDGLIVPVVKNADQKSLTELSQSIRTVASKARERTLAPEDVRGGTFTVTNLGARGGGYRFETVIINQPESAILGTGGITDRPVVRDGQIVIRPIMTYYLTYDHRVIDGATAAEFIGRLSRYLESPGLLLA
jgi:pyruvate dehydrogenase E2 component (dihydrolipoamide acetyltransferase)